LDHFGKGHQEVMLAGRLLLAGLLLAGCAQSRASVLSERVRDVRGVVESARHSGARRCAPRELALAQAHLDFAQGGLDAEDFFGAEDHLQIAEINAREALRLSPPRRCGGDRVPASPVGSPGVPSRRAHPAVSTAPARQARIIHIARDRGENRRVEPVIMQEYARR
jgi:hypothetical protein